MKKSEITELVKQLGVDPSTIDNYDAWINDASAKINGEVDYFKKTAIEETTAKYEPIIAEKSKYEELYNSKASEIEVARKEAEAAKQLAKLNAKKVDVITKFGITDLDKVNDIVDLASLRSKTDKEFVDVAGDIIKKFGLDKASQIENKLAQPTPIYNPYPTNVSNPSLSKASITNTTPNSMPATESDDYAQMIEDIKNGKVKW